MPTFTPHGPFVPDELVQNLEDDQVILFCGAGISMDAGLPNFSDLVRQAYTALGASVPPNKDPIWSWPDRMLGELEQRYPVGEMRRAIVSILNKEPTTLQYHTALLQLAKLTL